MEKLLTYLLVGAFAVSFFARDAFARDAFVRTNRRAITMMFVRLSVCPSVWDVYAL